jgi:hypothetical protein
MVIIAAITEIVMRAIFSPTATAYDSVTHNQIVIDAVEFMLSPPQQSKAKVGGFMPNSDYELMRSVLAPNKIAREDVAREVRLQARLLGRNAKLTDSILDIRLQSGSGTDSDPQKLGISFTMFSHFLNVYGEPTIWPDAGYYFGWVEQTKENDACKGLYYKDLFANLFIAHGSYKYDYPGSETTMKYRSPRQKDVTMDDYRTHFSQDIKNIHFWPITNLADHYYQRFKNSNKTSKGLPEQLPILGHVLHAVADTTVPFHAVGLSGCGHSEYERMVDGLVTSKERPYDGVKVMTYLETIPYLSHQTPLSELLKSNASAAAEYCQCDSVSCSCGIVNDETVARKLYNMAVASTVTTIRKCLAEWKAARNKPIGPELAGNIIPPKQERVFSNWMWAPLPDPKIKSSEPNHEAAIKYNLRNQFGEMKSTIGDLQRGVIVKTAFKQRMEGLVDDAAGLTDTFPSVEWDLSTQDSVTRLADGTKVGVEPIKFRPPTLEEIRDNQKWGNYLKERIKFHASLELFDIYVRLASMQSKLKRVNPGEKVQFHDAMLAFDDRANSLIDRMQ